MSLVKRLFCVSILQMLLIVGLASPVHAAKCKKVQIKVINALDAKAEIYILEFKDLDQPSNDRCTRVGGLDTLVPCGFDNSAWANMIPGGGRIVKPGKSKTIKRTLNGFLNHRTSVRVIYFKKLAGSGAWTPSKSSHSNTTRCADKKVITVRLK